MADIRDKDSIQHLYTTLLPKLAERIYQNLTEVIPLFDDFRLEKIVDTWTQAPESTNKEISIENGNVSQMGLRLQLLGFKKAGIQDFDVAKDLILKLEHTFYTIGPDKHTAWLEKLYSQTWNTAELEETAQRWCEEVIDAITRLLQERS